MLALSTAWLRRIERPLDDSIALLVEQGFRAFELNFVVHPISLDVLARCKARWDIEITSLHNVCSTLSEPLAPDDVYGDNVAALDEDQRRQSAGHLRSTAEAAVALGAQAVVIHGGSVPALKRQFQEDWYPDTAVIHDGPVPAVKADRTYSELLRAFGKGQVDGSTVKAEMRRRVGERNAVSRPYLQQLLKTLREVCPDFPTLRFGLESRYHYFSFPNIDELDYLLDELKLPNVGYWHDCGHAQFQEHLGLCRHVDWLERYGARLIGVHLHGMSDPIHDHCAPAPGNMPFELVRRYLRPDTLRVLELAPDNSLAAVVAGRNYLEQLFATPAELSLEKAAA